MLGYKGGVEGLTVNIGLEQVLYNIRYAIYIAYTELYVYLHVFSCIHILCIYHI